MGAVSNLLESKGFNILSVEPESLIHDALEKMEDISAGTALVMEGETLLGIIAERDVIRKVILLGKSIDDVKVQDVMTSDLITVSPESSLDECLLLMTEKRIRHLPVLREEKLCGIISTGDIVKYLIAEKEFKIKNLETYITGAMG